MCVEYYMVYQFCIYANLVEFLTVLWICGDEFAQGLFVNKLSVKPYSERNRGVWLYAIDFVKCYFLLDLVVTAMSADGVMSSSETPLRSITRLRFLNSRMAHRVYGYVFSSQP